MLLATLLLAPAARGTEPEIGLTEAVRQALAANLPLLSRRQALTADREQIALERAALLPQLGVGARVQALDSNRSDSARGNNKERSVLLAAGLSQVLYDEDSWASLQIQEHVYEGQVQDLEAFRLGVVQDAAGTFLELDRSQRLLEIQESNRELTRRNLETSRARIAAGWSSDREILRWEAQLAANDSAVRATQVQVLQNRFALNRVRNLPPEQAAVAAPSAIADYGFAYAREAIATAVRSPEQDRRMRDYLVRLGLRRSPELAALDASLAAAERRLLASRRAFWVPDLTLSAGVDHLANQRSGEDFNATEWGAKGVLTFPVFQGGAKFAGYEQAQASLASLRTERRATAQSVEQSIRAAFARASGSYESVGFAARQTAAARRNFELVDASYTLGVASILDLLDAQSQLLDAQVSENDTYYGFLEDLVAAERAVAFYAFLEPAADVEAVLEELERELGLRP